MVVRVIEAKEDKVTMADLIADLKKSNKVDYSGAIFTFEGIVHGKEENMNLEKLSLFLVAVLGGHRGESLDALREVIEKVKYDVEFKKEEISDNGTKTILAGG